MRRVSVVIPSYNHARFVAEAIESVLAQSHPELELVVVDDGSTDGSQEIIAKSLERASGVRAVYLEQKNEGAHHAIARGVASTSGEIVTILNSDDRYRPERLARILAELPSRGDFLAFSLVHLIDATGDPMHPDTETARGYRHALYEASRCPTVGFGLLRNNFAVTTGNLVFSRTLYEKIGGFRSYRLAHDWDFLLRSLLHVEPILVPEPLLDYRTHGNNTRTQLQDVVQQEGRAILRDYFARCEQERPVNPLAPCEENWPVYFDLFVTRYHTWFGWGPIREWLEGEESERARALRTRSWRPWDACVAPDPVDDCYYLVDAELPPARRAALALARDVLISQAHPLAVEEGPGPDSLHEVFERQAHPMPRLRMDPWLSPVRLGFPGRPGTHAGAFPTPASAPPRRLVERLRRSTALAPARRAASYMRQRQAIERSGVFDAEYYREQCRAKRLRVVDPVGHYLRVGAALGLDPHPLFDSRHYLARHPDVVGRNPLVHYLFHGDAEGRSPHPLFDPIWYRWAHPDVARSGMNALSHYILYGAGEGRRVHPRFDPEYYVEMLGETPGPDANILAHYAVHGVARGIALNRAEELRDRFERTFETAPIDDWKQVRERSHTLPRRLRASGAFDVTFYRSVWGPDFGDIADGARHFVERGALDGSPLGPPDRIEEWLRDLEARHPGVSHEAHAYLREAESPRPVADGHRVTIWASSAGNSFFREIALLLAHGFRSAGAEARVLDEHDEPEPVACPGRDHSIIVAPHEFFRLGEGSRRLSFEFLRRSSIWLAEQPGSSHFSHCLWYARFARRVLDTNPLTAVAWSELGLPARAFPLGWVAGFPDYAEGVEFASPAVRASQAPAARRFVPLDAPLADRPIDVFFNGVLTERRERFFAENAGLFAELSCALFMPTPRRPVTGELASALSAGDATALAQRAKISLNIHRDEMPYFEWHRIVVRGIWQQSLVVTEPSLRVPWLEPGLHYVECEIEELPRKLEWLLRTPEGRAEAEAIRQRALAAVRRRYPLRSFAASFLAEEEAES
jgi:glycosyltransferase involved in cell wall biosynthesis